MLSANPELIIDPDQFFGAANSSPDILFRVTFEDTLENLELGYDWSIDWGDGNVVTDDDLNPDATLTFQVQSSPGPGEPEVVGRLTAPPNYAASGEYTVIVTVNGTVVDDTTVDVYDLDFDLGLPDPDGSISVADEGSEFTLNLPTELLDENDVPVSIQSWRINWGDEITTDSDGGPTAKHTYADDVDIRTSAPSYNITAVAFTSLTEAFYAAGTHSITVLDVEATTTISGPNGAQPFAVNENEEFALNFLNADPGNDPVHQWRVFWEGPSGPFEAFPGNQSSVTHTYTTGGASHNIVAVAISDDGVDCPPSNVLAVTVNETAQDGVFLVGGMLSVIDSNAANDIVTVTQSGTRISVNSNGNTTDFSTGDVDEIKVLLGSGHDVVVISPNITVDVTIDGGDGNDFLAGGGGDSTLIGGNGNDILWGAAGDDTLLGGDGNDDLFGGGGNDALVGGTGNDIVTGGVGRDLLIGSENQDLLVGGNGEDILIGGTTDHDNDTAALDNIMAIWGSTDDFDTRVATLTGSSGLLQSGAICDDDALDIIIGGAGRDLVFGDTNPAGDGVVDLIALNAIQDTLVALN